MSEAGQWTPEAEARLKEIPFFVRPAAPEKKGLCTAHGDEKFEKSAIQEIRAAVYEQARQKFGS